MIRPPYIACACGLLLAGACATPPTPPPPPIAALTPSPQVVTPTVVTEAAQKPTPLEQMDLLHTRLAEEEAGRKRLERILAERDEAAAGLRSRLAELEEDVRRRDADLTSLTGKNEDLGARIAILEKQIHTLEEERRVLAQRYSLERLERLTLEKELLEREIAERTWKEEGRP